jgi:uncharacterized protein YjbJ (UPF0337 family)
MSNEAQKTPVAAAPAAKQDNATPMTPEAKAEKISAEIKKSWNKLSDDDAKLFPAQADKFFAALKEKQGVSKEDGQKRLDEIKASCGSCSSEKAA